MFFISCELCFQNLAKILLRAAKENSFVDPAKVKQILGVPDERLTVAGAEAHTASRTEIKQISGKKISIYNRRKLENDMILFK